MHLVETRLKMRRRVIIRVATLHMYSWFFVEVVECLKSGAPETIVSSFSVAWIAVTNGYALTMAAILSTKTNIYLLGCKVILVPQ